MTTWSWFPGDYLERNWSEVAYYGAQHINLTLWALALAAAIALPLAVAAHRFPRASSSVVGTAAVLYTVPSFALFALLAPFTGIGRTTVLIGLVAYALLVVVRNVLVGLGSVDRDVLDAARGLGLSRGAILWQVEIPHAIPATIAGLRLAAVTTVALVTVGVIVGYGGLGQLMFRGLQSNYHEQIIVASLACVLMALVLDVLLAVTGRVLTPWTRRRSA